MKEAPTNSIELSFKEFWNELSEALNKVGPVIKNVEEWQEVYVY